MENFIRSVNDTMARLSNQFGTGVLVNDVMAFLVIMGLLSMLLALVAFRKSASLKLPPGIDRAASVAGRVEKLEMTLNEFRIETVRNMELFRGDLGFLKQELAEIRKILRNISVGGSGSDGGGMPPSGNYPGTHGSEGPDDGHKFSSSDDDRSFQSALYREEEPDVIEKKPVFLTEEIKTEKVTQPEPLNVKLHKTRTGLFEKIKSIFSRSRAVDQEALDELEAQLVTSDFGVKMSHALISELKSEHKSGKVLDETALLGILKDKITQRLQEGRLLDTSLFHPAHWQRDVGKGPFVVMVVGVNGVGKTTTSAKLAFRYKQAGARVMLAAADTFRAAAVEQLAEWGVRVDVPVVRGAPEAKPMTVVYDAMVRASKEHVDVLIIDTAGRLHTKSNLMQELEGVRNAVSRHSEDGPHETILVLDGSTGQNALSQAKEFNAAVKLSGLIITKLDGTAKGGIVVAIKDELGIPVQCIGVGESKEDLRVFDAKEFVDAIFDNSGSSSTVATEQTTVSAHGEVRRRRREEAGSLMV